MATASAKRTSVPGDAQYLHAYIDPLSDRPGEFRRWGVPASGESRPARQRGGRGWRPGARRVSAGGSGTATTTGTSVRARTRGANSAEPGKGCHPDGNPRRDPGHEHRGPRPCGSAGGEPARESGGVRAHCRGAARGGHARSHPGEPRARRGRIRGRFGAAGPAGLPCTPRGDPATMAGFDIAIWKCALGAWREAAACRRIREAGALADADMMPGLPEGDGAVRRGSRFGPGDRHRVVAPDR